MNYWKGSKSWVLVWCFSILVGCLILYKGYQSSLSVFTQERAQKVTITNLTAQALLESTTQNATDGGEAQLLKTQTGERTVEDAQASASKGSATGQEIRGEQKLVLEQANSSERPFSIKDFPSPVQGNLLRGVGNYYSEALENYIFHAGLDYAEPEGTMIRATHGGRVVSIGLDPILGQKVILDCGDGWLVTYGGLDNLRVQVGETVVTQGALGQVGFFPGSEGQNGQTQLHYEVWHGNEVQRP